MRAAALALGAAASTVPVSSPAAQADERVSRQIAQAALLGDMRKRDRFGLPAEELAAWEEWASFVFAEPDLLPAVEAETHLGLAIARFYAKQFESGLEAAQAARAVTLPPRRRTGFETELEAYTALLLMELGRLDEADTAARAAMAEAQKTQLAPDVALALNARASLAFARNDLPKALEAFCEARDLGLGDGWADPGMVVTNASSCAALHFFLETPETLPAIRIARDYATANLPPDHPRMGNIYNTGYAILTRFGRYAEAQDLVRRHLELERSLHAGDADDVFDPLSMLARIRERLGAYEDAEELFGAAADMAERLGSKSQPYSAGITRANQARVLANLGRIDAAEATARSGLARLRADLAEDDWHIGSVQVLLADIAGQQGRAEEGLALVDQGLVLLSAKLPDDHSEVLTGQLVRAQLLALLGRHGEAVADARVAVAMLETQLFDLAASEQEQVALEAVSKTAFARYLDVAVRGGFAEDAVRAGQLQLLSSLAVSNARIAGARALQDEGVAASLRAYEEAQSEVAEAEKALVAAQEEGASTQAPASRLGAARGALQAASEALQSSYPAWAQLTRPQVSSLAELQSGLGDGELLVLPLSLPDRAVTLAIAADSFAWGESPVRETQLAALSAKLREGIAQPERFDPVAAHQLFQHVFPESLASLLPGYDTLIFPASGYLSRIPPAMLLAGEVSASGDLANAPWLVRSHAIAIASSLSHGSRKDALDVRGQTAFLGIGAPPPSAVAPGEQTFRAALGPLPLAAQELAALADALDASPAQVITGEDATERNFREASHGGNDVLAFATHGLVGGEVPGLSEPALLLAPDLTQSALAADGILTASEIAGMQLDADWVILSACNTAAGADGSAAAYSGLANAFAEAGARSLMLSHWRVRDDAAAFLSVETVRAATRGAKRPEALRQAQLALLGSADITGAAHPAIWAPFVILEN